MSCDVGEVTERLENELSWPIPHLSDSNNMGGSPGELSEELVT